MYATAHRILGQVLPEQLNYGSQKASDEDRGVTNQVEGNVDQALDNARREKGVPLTPVEIREIVYREAAEIQVDTPWYKFDDTVDPLERKNITSDQAANASFENVPSEAMRVMRRDARRGNSYPNGNVPQEVAQQAYASLTIATTFSLSAKIRQEAAARYRLLLLGE